MENFITSLAELQAQYSREYEKWHAHIDRAYNHAKASKTAAVMNRELRKRFERGAWCICWSQCMDEGEITPVLDLTDDKDNCVPLLTAPNSTQFPKIDRFSSWSWSLYWYLLKEQDIIVAHDGEATDMIVVFEPKQLPIVENFITGRKKYTLYTAGI